MSRWDDVGLWWEDAARVARGQRERPTPAIPVSDWLPPKDFPNLSAAKIIGLDTETKDPNLTTKGPGWARKDGHIVGVSLSVAEGQSWYWPLRHEMQADMNVEIEPVFRFLRDVMAVDRPVAGANLLYDMGWLMDENIPIAGKLYDILYAEALMDDTAKNYSLDRLAHKYLGEGKESEDLYKWCDLAFGGGAKPLQRKNIWRAPVTLVGPYAEGDAHQPLQILTKQWTDLVDLGLIDVFDMECRLIPVLYGIQMRGVTVDLEKADLAGLEMERKEKEAQSALNEYAGFEVGVNINEDLEALCDQRGIKYPVTEAGNSSFVQKWLENHRSVGMRLVTEVRKLQKARVTFIENGILDKEVDGVIHASYHPLRSEDGGAVSGRYSSSKPNEQQIPSRNPYLAPLIRGLYVPEKHYSHWAKLDLSQIEYRLFAHDSEDPQLVEAYQDPEADFHAVVGEYLGGKLIRTVTKGFNFGKLYGMGAATLCQGIRDNLPLEEILRLVEQYDLKVGHGMDPGDVLGNYFIAIYEESFPAASKTLQRYSTMAQDSGEVRTILGRRSTFNLYEPAQWGHSKPLPYDVAVEKWGYGIRRAQTHKALNRRLQGGAADLMKKGMLDAYEAGLFAPDKMGFPHVIVHDEWGFSYHEDIHHHFVEFKSCIENTIKLKVPVILGLEIGPDWGHVKEIDL